MKELAKKNISFSDNPDSYRYLNADSWLFDYDRKKTLLSQVFDTCTYFSYDPNDNVKKFLEAIHINNVYTGNYKLNATVGSHYNFLQRIKKRLTTSHGWTRSCGKRFNRRTTTGRTYNASKAGTKTQSSHERSLGWRFYIRKIIFWCFDIFALTHACLRL